MLAPVRNSACRDYLHMLASWIRKLLESRQCLLPEPVLSVRMEMRRTHSLARLLDPLFQWGLELSVISNVPNRKHSNGIFPRVTSSKLEVIKEVQKFSGLRWTPGLLIWGHGFLQAAVFFVVRLFMLSPSLLILQCRKHFHSNDRELQFPLEPQAPFLSPTLIPRLRFVLMLIDTV